MYFRIIVKNAGVFAFRTSKIKSEQALGQMLTMLGAGFIAANEAGHEFSAEVLQVEGDPVGKILSQSELDKLMAEDDEVGDLPTGTAEIAGALAFDPINGTK